jgi:phosphopantetheine adenylyltransferase
VHALEDPLGSAVSEARYTAIVCSEETLKGCSVINERRAGNGLPPLKVFVVPVLADKNTGTKLSSTVLRKAREDE